MRDTLENRISKLENLLKVNEDRFSDERVDLFRSELNQAMKSLSYLENMLESTPGMFDGYESDLKAMTTVVSRDVTRRASRVRDLMHQLSTSY